MSTTKLEDRIAVLEQLVTELRAHAERPPRRDSMSKTLTCPICGGGSILGVREIKEHTHGGLVPLAIGNRSGFWTSKTGAPLQAYICKSCLLVEWHLASIDNLVVDGENVIAFERQAEPSPPSLAPYR
jgi:hypothetical protein